MQLSHGGRRGHVDLTLDLLACPPSGVNGARAVFPVVPSLPNKRGDPFIAEVAGKLSIGECICEITGSSLGKR